MDTQAKQTAGMHGTGTVMQADTVQGLAVSADGFTVARRRLEPESGISQETSPYARCSDDTASRTHPARENAARRRRSYDAAATK
jgi:hypothetical protein